ncbi:hypothetical protein DMENIID0001_093150 [Sergentomyia squamirostris]
MTAICLWSHPVIDNPHEIMSMVEGEKHMFLTCPNLLRPSLMQLVSSGRTMDFLDSHHCEMFTVNIVMFLPQLRDLFCATNNHSGSLHKNLSLGRPCPGQIWFVGGGGGASDTETAPYSTFTSGTYDEQC